MFEVGAHVVCSFRLPSARQPWLHGQVLVGEVLEPGDDPAAWNGRNSERDYCETTGRVPVLYRLRAGAEGFVQHDPVGSLCRAPDGLIDWPYPAQLVWAVAPTVAAVYIRSGLWIVDRYDSERVRWSVLSDRDGEIVRYRDRGRVEGVRDRLVTERVQDALKVVVAAGAKAREAA